MSEKYNMSIFRKVALASWNKGGDPSVYGFVDLDMTEALRFLQHQPGVTASHLVLRSLGLAMKQIPELRGYLRWGKIALRETADISMMVHVRAEKKDHVSRGHDLSFVTLRAVDEMSLSSMAKFFAERKQQVKSRKDPALGRALKVTDFFPVALIRPALRLISWWTTQLGWSIPFLKLSSFPFGSIVVTQIGSFGIKKGFVPLVPISQAVALVSIGTIHDEVIAVEGQPVVRPMLSLGFTLDHRFVDGAHAGQLAQIVQDYFKAPH